MPYDKNIGHRARRLSFPLFTSSAPGTLDLSADDLARIEREEDRRRHGFLAEADFGVVLE
jgi:hypothetical protein